MMRFSGQTLGQGRGDSSSPRKPHNTTIGAEKHSGVCFKTSKKTPHANVKTLWQYLRGFSKCSHPFLIALFLFCAMKTKLMSSVIDSTAAQLEVAQSGTAAPALTTDLSRGPGGRSSGRPGACARRRRSSRSRCCDRLGSGRWSEDPRYPGPGGGTASGRQEDRWRYKICCVLFIKHGWNPTKSVK